MYVNLSHSKGQMGVSTGWTEDPTSARRQAAYISLHVRMSIYLHYLPALYTISRSQIRKLYVIAALLALGRQAGIQNAAATLLETKVEAVLVRLVLLTDIFSRFHSFSLIS